MILGGFEPKNSQVKIFTFPDRVAIHFAGISYALIVSRILGKA